jgi:hypothetical protein
MSTSKTPATPPVLPPLRIPFDYVVNAIVPLNSTGFNVSLQIQQDADFELVFLVGTRTSPLADVTMSDGATGRSFMSGPVNVDNFFGTAQLPFPLVEPYIVARSTSVNFQFRDTSGSQNTIQVVLRGYKLFPQQNPAQGSAGLISQAH